MLHISMSITRYGMFGILLERSNYALSNDVIKKSHFLMYVTTLSTGTGFYITSLTCVAYSEIFIKKSSREYYVL